MLSAVESFREGDGRADEGGEGDGEGEGEEEVEAEEESSLGKGGGTSFAEM